MKKPRLFLRTGDGEGWYFCGDLPPDEKTMRSIGHLLQSEIDGVLMGAGDEQLTVDFKKQDMTDEEVDALPDV